MSVADAEMESLLLIHTGRDRTGTVPGLLGFNAQTGLRQVQEPDPHCASPAPYTVLPVQVPVPCSVNKPLESFYTTRDKMKSWIRYFLCKDEEQHII